MAAGRTVSAPAEIPKERQDPGLEAVGARLSAAENLLNIFVAILFFSGRVAHSPVDEGPLMRRRTRRHERFDRVGDNKELRT
jgi:hypothetical protein